MTKEKTSQVFLESVYKEAMYSDIQIASCFILRILAIPLQAHHVADKLPALPFQM